MHALREVGVFVITAVVVLLELAGVVIPIASDRYSAKQAMVACAIPPYAMYIAATYPFSNQDEAESVEESWAHLDTAIDACNAASASAPTDVSADAPAAKVALEICRSHWKRALSAARLIDCSQLGNSDKEVADAVRMYLIPGLELLVRDGSTEQDLVAGISLLGQFGEVFSEFFERVRSENAP